MSVFPLTIPVLGRKARRIASAVAMIAAVALFAVPGMTAQAGGAMNEVVGIVKVTPKASSVVFTVCEREPYDKTHYDITVFRSLPPKFLLAKTSAPRSAFDEPRLIDLEYSFDELGIGPGQRFFLQNPLSLPSC